MTPSFKKQLGVNQFSRLGILYVLALSVIAAIAIIGQALIQIHLKNQLSDSRVVNVAGRQRMLSQKISKHLLELKPDQTPEQRTWILERLKPSLELWKVSQHGLQQGNDEIRLPGGNSDTVTTLFERIKPHFDEMYAGASRIVTALEKNPSLNYDSLKEHVENVIKSEPDFLDGMNAIVFQYDREAKDKVKNLSRLEYLLIAILIVVILLEIILVFKPTAAQVNQTVNQLIVSEQNAKRLSKEIGALYGSLEKSYEQLSQIKQPIETPKLCAKSDKGGNIKFISDLFAEKVGLSETDSVKRLCDLFPGSGLGDDWMDELVELASEGQTWQGEIRYIAWDGREAWAEVIVMPLFNDRNEFDELMALASDITMQKHAEQSMRNKNRAEVEKKINQQKFRSVLILEGQEEERKRIAMDIHDGIGQMLTSLKFQIESIDSQDNPDTDRKIADIKLGIKDVIKEVRKVTFNLKPTVLGDFGLQAALNVFVQEIGKLTDIELAYYTEGDLTSRLPQKVENNIFRIVQEAINNAIKYSKADRIEVKLQQTESDLIITVKDEGEGFDEKIVEARDINIESGRGFFNMYERTEYISGKLEIKSAPGMGTSVRLTVPLQRTATIDT
jgi:PAS domain S-box-containing protein